MLVVRAQSRPDLTVTRAKIVRTHTAREPSSASQTGLCGLQTDTYSVLLCMMWLMYRRIYASYGVVPEAQAMKSTPEVASAVVGHGHVCRRRAAEGRERSVRRREVVVNTASSVQY